MTGDYRLLILVLWPFAGAWIGYLIGKKDSTYRDYFADFVVIAEFVYVLWLFPELRGGGTTNFLAEGFCGLNLHLRLDGFREIYGSITAYIWMMTTLISREYFAHYQNRNRYYLFVLPTLGATMGLFLSADLFTVYLFCQIISFTSFVGIAHDERDTALKAASTYLAAEIIGGSFIFSGLSRLYQLFGTLEIDELRAAVSGLDDRTGVYVAGVLLLFGFGAKAGMFPMHFWMGRAHAGSPAPISTLLSSIITKTGLFGVILVCANIFIEDKAWGIFLLVLGTFTMLLGAVRAIFGVHVKRILAFSSLSQIGFILMGIGSSMYLGAQNQTAVHGALLHMVNHSLLKLLLYLCAAVIYMRTHTLHLDDIRGYGRGKPLLHAAFLCGALGLGCVPFFNGYVSKTLLHEGIVECMHLAAEIGGPYILFLVAEMLFLLGGGMTIAYMMKLYFCIFIQKHPTDQEKFDNLNKHYIGKATTAALIGASAVIPVLGMFPHLFLERVALWGQGILNSGLEPYVIHPVHYFQASIMKGSLLSIGAGVVIYFSVIRKALMKQVNGGAWEYVYRWPKKLDLEDLIYRPLIERWVPDMCGAVCSVLNTPILYRAIQKMDLTTDWREKKKENDKKRAEDRRKMLEKRRLKDHNKYR